MAALARQMVQPVARSNAAQRLPPPPAVCCLPVSKLHNQRPCALQAFDVILSYEHSDSGTSWQRLRRCGSSTLGADAAAHAPGCTLSAPAVVDSTLVVRQPGSLSDAGGIPEPCTLTVRSATSPQLITASLLGAALLVRGQRWCRSRAGSALIRTCCVGVPLLVAVAGTALLASLAVVSTAGIELLLAQLPVQPPK